MREEHLADVGAGFSRPAMLKVCGITRLTDALHAIDYGATALGFVFWRQSPRYVTPERAAEIIAELPPGTTTVGVFVNEAVDGIRDVASRTGVRAIQLHGDEPVEYADALGCAVLRSVTVDDADETCATWPSETTFLLDAADRVRRGGTGNVVNWSHAAALARSHRVVLAGGLTPVNVADAIARVRPFGVDVSSGVEDAPGVKNLDKVARFLENARHAFQER